MGRFSEPPRMNDRKGSSLYVLVEKQMGIRSYQISGNKKSTGKNRIYTLIPVGFHR